MTQAAPAVAFYCVLPHHNHAMDYRRDWRPFETCGCCESWVVPAPPAVAVACFGPRGVEDVCRQCLDAYLGTCSCKDREGDPNRVTVTSGIDDLAVNAA